MKWLVIVFVVLVVFVVVLIVGLMLLGDKGYVFILLGNIVVEMMVISFCILVIGVVIVWYVLFWFVLWVLSLIIGLYKWFGILGECKCKCVFYDGLYVMVVGDFDMV